MTKYWLNNLRKTGMGSLVAVVMTGSLIGCTKTDDTMGNDTFIPDGGDYKMYVGAIDGGFLTKTVQCDSVASDNFSVAYLGSQVTTKEGQINYSFVNQVWHYGIKYPDNKTNEPFGYDVQVDSAFLSLAVSRYLGEEGQKYMVYVYELTKPLPNPLDSTYYSNFKIDEYIGKDPLFSIDAEFGKQITQKIPNEYAKKYLSLNTDQYGSYDNFRSHFYGYYFKTSKISSGNMICEIDPSESVIAVYYHNKNEKPDTSTFLVDFSKSYTDPYYNRVHYVNEGFNLIDRDYSFKDANFGVQLDSKTITYASGMAGLITELEVPQSVIDELKFMVKSKGGSKIIVSNATMVLPVGETDINSLDQSLKGIGIYRNYQKLASIYDRKNTLDDYYISLYPEYSSVALFGGALSRSTNQFRINVSSMIQGLVNGTSDDRKIEIGPSYKNAETIGAASFENSNERPIRLELTYSVVK